jgi:hypothetical protein
MYYIYPTKNQQHNRRVFSRSAVSGNPITTVLTIKRKVMTRNFTHNETIGPTARPDSQLNEFLFFALPHFLFFSSCTAVQVAHFVLLQTHKSTQSQTKRATSPNTSIII